jgi:hypothetical protein
MFNLQHQKGDKKRKASVQKRMGKQKGREMHNEIKMTNKWKKKK